MTIVRAAPRARDGGGDVASTDTSARRHSRACTSGRARQASGRGTRSDRVRESAVPPGGVLKRAGQGQGGQAGADRESSTRGRGGEVESSRTAALDADIALIMAPYGPVTSSLTPRDAKSGPNRQTMAAARAGDAPGWSFHSASCRRGKRGARAPGGYS